LFVTAAGFSCRRLGLWLPIEVSVEADKVVPVRWHFVVLEDGIYGALRLAETTADALVGVDKELVVGLLSVSCCAGVDGVHWTDGDTGLVLADDTIFRDNKCHNGSSFCVAYRRHDTGLEGVRAMTLVTGGKRMEPREALRQVLFLKTAGDEAIAALMAVGSERRIGKGEQLFTEFERG
jgi:hypothetical protein